MPGVVPDSDKFLQLEDADGNQVWRVTAFKEQTQDFIRIMKKNGFLCQEFNYDNDAYVANKNLEASLRQEMRSCNERLLQRSYHNFQELFIALVHLKIMRTFIEGVLRYGIPPAFVLGVIKPNKMYIDKIKKNLEDEFKEAHLAQYYGAKEETQDEDFFPYIMNVLHTRD